MSRFRVGNRFLILVLLILVRCGTNRLNEVTFRQTTAAAVMAVPPRAQVFSDSFWGIGGDPISAVIRIGTAVAKGIQAGEAQERLDEAMSEVDIPEQVRERTLSTSATYLEFTPVESAEGADFLFMMKIKEYGIDAKSWSASVDFKIDVQVQLVDRNRNVLVWKKSIREEMPVTGFIFGLGETVGDVITAAALSELSKEEMVRGFSHLGDYVADRIAERIQEDFIRAHEKQ